MGRGFSKRTEPIYGHILRANLKSTWTTTSEPFESALTARPGLERDRLLMLALQSKERCSPTSLLPIGHCARENCSNLNAGKLASPWRAIEPGASVDLVPRQFPRRGRRAYWTMPVMKKPPLR